MSVKSVWKDGDRIRQVEIVPQGEQRYIVRVDDAEIALEAEWVGGELRVRASGGEHRAEITAIGARRFVHVSGMDFVFDRETTGRKRSGTPGGSLEAPMPGVVTRVLVAAGDTVTQGQPLLALEAMKMEHVIRAPRDGRIKSITARAGEMVAAGVALVELEEPAA